MVRSVINPHVNTHFWVFLWDSPQILLELVFVRKVRTTAEPRYVVGVSVLDKFVEMVVAIRGKGSLMEVSQTEGRPLPSWFRIEGGLWASRTMNDQIARLTMSKNVVNSVIVT
jgi:hypothetical protein